MTTVSDVTSLLVAINAMDCAQCAPKYEKENRKHRNRVYRIMLTMVAHAVRQGVPIAKLNTALQKAGWDDQVFSRTPSNGIRITTPR